MSETAVQDISLVPNLEEHIVLDISNDNIDDDHVKKILEYYNPTTSYFKKYDIEIYNNIQKILSSNPTKLFNIINNKISVIEAQVIKFLQAQEIGSLDKSTNRYKLNRIVRQYPIPGITNKPENPFTDLALALIIEKYYTNHNGSSDSDSISLTDVLEEISENDSFCNMGNNNNNNNNKQCPSFPPDFQKPVFNPCEYPYVLKLYSHFFEHCYDYRNLHGLAGAYYNQMSKKFTAPTLVLSAFSSISSFIASSEIIKDNWKLILTLSVGIMTTLTAMIQAFSSAFQFDSKANSHFKAADNYDQLITEIDFEKCYPNDNEFFQNLEKKVLEVKSNSQYMIPQFIKSEYYRSKEKATDRDFINKNIIKPMEHDLKEAIVGGNMNNYKYADQGELIKQELVKLRQLKTMFFEEEQLRKKCASDKCCNKNNKISLSSIGGFPCCWTCNKIDKNMIKNTTYDTSIN